ncbi:MAG: hypothetical protein JO104_06680 [Candidatus Eremiobacteraeota bacterium]|nr:hypothetical protein [Candidatus Eremiobacteraeota bacterium]
MPKRCFYRVATLTVGFVLAFGSAATKAPAALDLSVGARKVVKSQAISACNAGAKSALNAVLQGASEVGSGDTGEWKAYGSADASGNSFAAAAIHCYPLDDGYLVTFTCAAQVPPNPDTASALCAKLTAAFGTGGQH